MGLWYGRALTVAEVDRKLTMDITQLREAVRQLTQDMVALRNPVQLRARLRQYDLDDEPGELEAMQAMMEIATMLGGLESPRGEAFMARVAYGCERQTDHQAPVPGLLSLSLRSG
jgi:hypothetical protein